MKYINQKHHQYGRSLYSLAFTLGALGFVLFTAYKIVPVYVDYLTITEVVEDMKLEDAVASKHPRAIREILTKRFNTNNLWDYELDDTVKIQKDPKHGIAMHIDYERRIPFIYNLDVVAKFNKMVVPD